MILILFMEPEVIFDPIYCPGLLLHIREKRAGDITQHPEQLTDSILSQSRKFLGYLFLNFSYISIPRGLIKNRLQDPTLASFSRAKMETDKCISNKILVC